MYESRLEQGDNGRMVLYCYYDRTLDDFNESIDRALNKHKLKPGEATFICLPQKEGNHEHRSNGTFE